nr:MAG TPA: hypothetical protein [Caudoviricetes sp.]
MHPYLKKIMLNIKFSILTTFFICLIVLFIKLILYIIHI